MYRTGSRVLTVSIVALAVAIALVPFAWSGARTLPPVTAATGQVHCKDETHLHVIVAGDILETPTAVTVTYQAVMPCKNVLGGTASGVVISKKPGKPFDGMHVLGSALLWLTAQLRSAADLCGPADTVSITHPEHGDFTTFVTLNATRTRDLANMIDAAYTAPTAPAPAP